MCQKACCHRAAAGVTAGVQPVCIIARAVVGRPHLGQWLPQCKAEAECIVYNQVTGAFGAGNFPEITSVISPALKNTINLIAKASSSVKLG